jgi:hypothetical protein
MWCFSFEEMSPTAYSIMDVLRRRNLKFAAFDTLVAGTYSPCLIVFFIQKAANMALVLSARDMDDKERRRRVTLAPELYTSIETQACMRGVLPETLVNLWLAERLQGAAVDSEQPAPSSAAA